MTYYFNCFLPHATEKMRVERKIFCRLIVRYAEQYEHEMKVTLNSI